MPTFSIEDELKTINDQFQIFCTMKSINLDKERSEFNNFMKNKIDAKKSHNKNFDVDHFYRGLVSYAQDPKNNANLRAIVNERAEDFLARYATEIQKILI